MAVRVTTNSMVRNYNSALSTSLNTLNRSREQVYSERKFVRAYQDPAGALQAGELQRKSDKIDQYLSTLTTAQSRQDSADGVLLQMVSLVGSTANDEGLKALSASTPETRKTYAATFRQLQNTLLQLANTTHGDSHILAGADGANPPFALAADGTVTYRGINVNDEAALSKYVDEKMYLNLGMGLQVDSGGIAMAPDDINGASAYNTAVSGIKALGYGTVDGSNPPISKNVLSLLGQMASELENPNFNSETFAKQRDQLLSSHSDMADFSSEMGVRTTFLNASKDRLEDEQISITEQLDKIVTAQPAAAITNYSYSQYVYNLVLKVGTSLLSNSFIDFMK